MHAPVLGDAGDVEEAVQEALRGLDAPDGAARRGVARQVHDAGDLVTGADAAQRAEVGDVGLLRGHGQVREVGGDLARAALHHDARLAEAVQGADGVGADEAGPAGDEDHGIPFVG